MCWIARSLVSQKWKLPPLLLMLQTLPGDRYHIGRHVVGQGDATVAAGGLQVIVDYVCIQI